MSADVSPSDVEPVIVAKARTPDETSGEGSAQSQSSFFSNIWLQCCEMRPGIGAAVGYTLSTVLGVALVVICVPQLWRLGYGEIRGLCFGCHAIPVFRLVSQPWEAIAFACLYLNGLVAGMYGIYQGIIWVHTGRHIVQQSQQESK